MQFRLFLASAALLCAQLAASPGHAATYYVAGGGTSATCLSDAPCSRLDTAMGLVVPGDTIICLSSPFPVSFLIEKSVTIDCSSARAPIRTSNVPTSDGLEARIVINIVPSTDDPLRTVRLRGLTIDGAARGNTFANGRTTDRGIDIQSAAAVYIDDCVVSNVAKQGIYDHRTGGQTKLFIKDTAVNGSLGGGIVAVSAAVGIIVLDNVTSSQNAYGIAIGTGNNVFIKNSVFSGNSVAGVEGDSGAQIILNGSAITHNNIGVQANGSVRLSNNDIGFNNTAISGSTGTFGNNRFSGNGSIGTTPTALGGASSDLGQR